MSTNAAVLDRAGTRDDVLQGYFDLIVKHAPVPVHVVDANFKITRVNRRWLDKLGYERSEVLGRPSTDFLSGESRERALRDVLPLFRRAGSSRSVGLNFETKVGRVVPILIDAQVCGIDARLCYAFAVLRDPDDPVQYEGASATFEALHGIHVIRFEARRGAVASASSTDAIDDEGAGPVVEKLGATQSRGRVPPDLTKREHEVLKSLASGARNREIAERLSLTTRTVRFHNESLFRKLDVQTRTQAVRIAIQQGLLKE